MALLGLEDPASKWSEEDGKKEDLAETVSQLLFTKAEMLQDYFSIEIDRNKNLSSIPLLLGMMTLGYDWPPTNFLKDNEEFSS